MISEILEALQRPNQWHAATVHVPVAVAVLGVGMALLLLLTRGKSGWVRWLTVTLYAVGLASALVALDSGQDAADYASEQGPRLISPAAQLLHDHEEMGEKVWIFMGLTAVLAAATLIPKPAVRWTFITLAVLAAIFTFVWVSYTGHMGGTLVYRYGVNVPRGVESVPATQPGR